MVLRTITTAELLRAMNNRSSVDLHTDIIDPRLVRILAMRLYLGDPVALAYVLQECAVLEWKEASPFVPLVSGQVIFEALVIQLNAVLCNKQFPLDQRVRSDLPMEDGSGKRKSVLVDCYALTSLLFLQPESSLITLFLESDEFSRDEAIELMQLSELGNNVIDRISNLLWNASISNSEIIIACYKYQQAMVKRVPRYQRVDLGHVSLNKARLICEIETLLREDAQVDGLACNLFVQKLHDLFPELFIQRSAIMILDRLLNRYKR